MGEGAGPPFFHIGGGSGGGSEVFAGRSLVRGGFAVGETRKPIYTRIHAHTHTTQKHTQRACGHAKASLNSRGRGKPGGVECTLHRTLTYALCYLSLSNTHSRVCIPFIIVYIYIYL